MYSGSRRYSKSGRIRYGSSVFVDDTFEDLVDTINGKKRDTSILIVYAFVMLVKFISANLIGIILMSIVFYALYYVSVLDFQLSFTKKRIFIIKEFRHPNIIRAFGWFFLGLSIFSGLKVIYPLRFDTTSPGIDQMRYFFDFFNVLPIFYLFYSQLVLLNLERILRFDGLVSVLIYIPLVIRFLFIRYHFTEIHNSHIGEVLISLDRDRGWWRSTFIISFVLILHIVFIQQFDIIIFLFLLIVNEFVPGKRISTLAIFGNSNRVIVNKIQIDESEFQKCTRAMGVIFDWTPQGDYKTRKFPNNVIPYEVASHYETGLRTSLLQAHRLGNRAGLFVSSTINIIVLLILTNFALNKNTDSLKLIGFLTIGLILFSIILYQGLKLVLPWMFASQREENLVIGQSFVGRYREPSLWIVRGNRLEGTNVQKGVKSKMIHYERNLGLVISWRRLIIYIIAIVVMVALVIWGLSGGINFANAFFIFPFLFDQSINFLSDKANAELGFYITVGYLAWIAIFFYSPQYYARSRPMLLLEMRYPDYIPIILKDFEDHQDASLQFTKCLMNSARPNRRQSVGRPGLFELDVYFNGFEFTDQIESGAKYRLMLGENYRKTEFVSLIEQNDGRIPIMKLLRASGERGYPLLNLLIEKKVNDSSSIVHQEVIELNNNFENLIEIQFEQNIKLHLLIVSSGGKP